MKSIQIASSTYKQNRQQQEKDEEGKVNQSERVHFYY